MKTFDEIAKGNDFISRRQAQETKKTLDARSVEIVNRLFVFFEAFCRGFDKQFPVEQQKKLNYEKINWARAFMDSGITCLEQIELGISKCRLESPINIPTVGQFLKWCKPSAEDLNLLPKEIAYNRAYDLMQNGSLPNLSDDQVLIIRHAIHESGAHFLKTNSMDKTQPVFYRNYEIATRSFLDGQLKPIGKGLEDKRSEWEEVSKQKKVAKDFSHLHCYEKAMPEIKAMLGIANHEECTAD